MVEKWIILLKWFDRFFITGVFSKPQVEIFNYCRWCRKLTEPKLKAFLFWVVRQVTDCTKVPSTSCLFVSCFVQTWRKTAKFRHRFQLHHCYQRFIDKDAVSMRTDVVTLRRSRLRTYPVENRTSVQSRFMAGMHLSLLISLKSIWWHLHTRAMQSDWVGKGTKMASLERHPLQCDHSVHISSMLIVTSTCLLF